MIIRQFKLKRVSVVGRLRSALTVKGKRSPGCLPGQETPSPPWLRRTASILPVPADIQGQVERTTGGLSATERCNRLALLVTSPLIPEDRCEECSRLVGRTNWLIGRFPPWAIMRTLTARYFQILPFILCAESKNWKRRYRSMSMKGALNVALQNRSQQTPPRRWAG